MCPPSLLAHSKFISCVCVCSLGPTAIHSFCIALSPSHRCAQIVALPLLVVQAIGVFALSSMPIVLFSTSTPTLFFNQTQLARWISWKQNYFFWIDWLGWWKTWAACFGSWDCPARDFQPTRAMHNNSENCISSFYNFSLCKECFLLLILVFQTWEVESASVALE